MSHPMLIQYRREVSLLLATIEHKATQIENTIHEIELEPQAEQGLWNLHEALSNAAIHLKVKI